MSRTRKAGQVSFSTTWSAFAMLRIVVVDLNLHLAMLLRHSESISQAMPTEHPVFDDGARSRACLQSDLVIK
jgi:hypothetical protein